jgi:hypothetical protein
MMLTNWLLKHLLEVKLANFDRQSIDCFAHLEMLPLAMIESSLGLSVLQNGSS